MRRKIHITCNGKHHAVYPIKHFPDTVLVEPNTGKLFLQYWKPAKERGARRQRSFREYLDVFTLFRCLAQIIESTKQNRIPTLDQLATDCQDITLKVNDIKVAAPGDINKAKRSIAKVLKQLKSVKAIELQEAQEQLEFAIIFRDKLGRLNTGMVCARLVAVRRRLKERLENIIYWLDHYEEWHGAISVFVTFHQHYLPRLEKRFADIADRELAQNTPEQNRLAIGRLTCIFYELANLENIGGWRLWALQSRKDIKQATTLIQEEKGSKAVAILRKLSWVTRLKIIQYDIQNLLLTVDLNEINGENRLDHYETRLKELISRINAIDETDFRTPVKTEVTVLLQSALDSVHTQNASSISDDWKNLLRQAYQKI